MFVISQAEDDWSIFKYEFESSSIMCRIVKWYMYLSQYVVMMSCSDVMPVMMFVVLSFTVTI